MKFDKKKITMFLPFLMLGYFFNKISQAFTSAYGTETGERILNGLTNFSHAFSNPLPSFKPIDLLVGAVGAVIIKLIVYVKGKKCKEIQKRL